MGSQGPSENALDVFNELPEEIVLQILLEPLVKSSFSLMPSLGVTNKLFSRISNDAAIWRALLDKYFPYLKDKNASEYHSDPKNCFKKEYLQYKKTDIVGGWEVGINTILDSLCGQIEKIDLLSNPSNEANEANDLQMINSGINKARTNHLYQMSLANGNPQAWSKLESYDRKCAFHLAAKNGSLQAVNWFLNEHANDITGADRAIALRLASVKENPAIVEALLLKSEGPAFEKQLKTEIRLVTPETRAEIYKWASKNNVQPILNALTEYDNFVEIEYRNIYKNHERMTM